MNQSVYRFKKATRIGISVSTLVCFIGAGWFIGRPSPLGAVFMWLISIVLVGLLSYATLKAWTYKLEVTEEGIHISTIFHSFSHYYETRAVVRRGPSPGFLEIDPEGRKPFRIAVQTLDGDPKELLNQLSAHIAPEFIAPDIEKLLTKDIVLANRLLGLTMITAVFAILNLAITRQDFFLSYVAFTSVGTWDSYTDVETFSLDSAGIPWFVKSRRIRDNYTVQKVADSEEQTWTMPFRLADWSEHGRPIGFASSPNGQFWVIHSRSIFHWTGETWNQISFPPGETELDVSPASIVTADSKLWATVNPPDDYKNAETIFFSLDLLSNEKREIPLPDSAVQAGLSMHHHLHQVGEDSLLMLMKGEQENRIYLFENDAWQEPGYVIVGPPSNDIVDFTMDPAGVIWVLLEKQNGLNTVGEFNSDTLTWNWFPLKSECAKCSEDYLFMEVDVHKRVWLDGSYGINKNYGGPILDIFKTQPDGTVIHSERYTPENSNWQSGSFGTQLRRTPDGRIWTADDRLVWMDSTRETLPRPLPEWMAVALSPIGNIFMSIMYLLPVIANMIILFKYQRSRVKFDTFNQESAIR